MGGIRGAHARRRYFLTEVDCQNCLILGDCTQAPRTADSTLNPAVDQGNELRPSNKQENELIPDIIHTDTETAGPPEQGTNKKK